MDDDQTQNDQQNPQQDLIDPDDAKHQQSKPPSVTGEEDIAGDMTAEPADIDKEMERYGKKIDPEYPKPLGEE